MWKQFIIFVQILSLTAVGSGCIIVYDVFIGKLIPDKIIVTSKEITGDRKNPSYYIKGNGDYSYRESVSKKLYDTASVGDTLIVGLTPTFKEWKYVGLLRNNQFVFVSNGEDISYILEIALFLFITLVSFFYKSSWRKRYKIIFWSFYSTVQLVNIITWVMLILLWTGKIHKI